MADVGFRWPWQRAQRQAKARLRRPASAAPAPVSRFVRQAAQAARPAARPSAAPQNVSPGDDEREAELDDDDEPVEGEDIFIGPSGPAATTKAGISPLLLLFGLWWLSKRRR